MLSSRGFEFPGGVLALLVLACLQGGCGGGPHTRLGGTHPAVPESRGDIPGDAPPRVEPGARAMERARSVVETALEAMGTPYRWGGTGENGFDCSGLIQFAYAQHGIDLPRVSRDQLREGWAVEPEVDQLRPGDVLGFSGEVGEKASHVGLYVGGGSFLHSSPRGVALSDLRSPYWRRHLIAARRMVR